MLVEQGDLQAALEAYTAGLAIADRLAKADPGNAGWQYDLGISNERIGTVLQAQGDQRQHSRLLRQSARSYPVWPRRTSATPDGSATCPSPIPRSGTCFVLRAICRPRLRPTPPRSLSVDRLAKADPGNAGWQRDLSVSHTKIGDVLAAQGNLPAALEAYTASLAIADRLAKADPGNAGWQRDLSVSHNKIGDVLVEQGNLPGRA